MASTHRLRIELPDRPGALAEVASVIAALGGDVVAVDIHELDRGTAVDEIVVATPDGWETGRLADALARSNAGMLLSSQHASDDVGARDPIVSSLGWCRAMVAAGPHACDLELGRAVLEITRAYAAWTCDVTDAIELPGGAVALERGGPVVVRTDALPREYADSLPHSVWVLAAPEPVLAPDIVVFAVRPTSLRFTSTDVARVEALLVLRRQLVTGARATVPSS